MVGDSLGLVLVIPVNKDARRAGEIDQIAFEIDLFHSGLRGLFLFGHATSDQVFQVSVSEEWEGGNEIGSNANKKAATNKLSEVHQKGLVEYLNTSLVQLCPRDPEALEARRKGRDAP
ncbi:unnamed protein product [Dovyalis caffra]|uniref:Uncharacterized protein n=1 Tax=Dovyalis caffra TaxID=77055 RepID=A0AAV1R485_9ROSI|nr:unnamed protein product [Dovyalis caffra]